MPARTDAARKDNVRRGGWNVANDYLADPAVAPLRALVAAAARRLTRRRRARATERQDGCDTRPPTRTLPTVRLA